MLTTLTLHILAALAGGDNYPSAILEQIGHDSRSTFLPPERSLYRALDRLAREGMIEATHSGSQGRLYYRLTNRGRRSLQAEQSRLTQLVSVLHERLS